MSWITAFDKPEVIAMLIMAPLLILLSYSLPRTRYLDHLEEIMIGSLIAGATILIFVAVMHRYGLSTSIALSKWGKLNGYPGVATNGRAAFDFLKDINLTWAQEVCMFMFVWMAKFGAAYGVRTGVHVGVDVALEQMESKSKHRVILFGLMCGALFTFIIGSFGTRFVWHLSHTDQTSPDLEMPMWLVYMAIPIGSYLMSFRFMQVAWTFSRTGELPHFDHAHVDGIQEAAATPIVPLDAVPAGGLK